MFMKVLVVFCICTLVEEILSNPTGKPFTNSASLNQGQVTEMLTTKCTLRYFLLYSVNWRCFCEL